MLIGRRLIYIMNGHVLFSDRWNSPDDVYIVIVERNEYQNITDPDTLNGIIYKFVI